MTTLGLRFSCLEAMTQTEAREVATDLQVQSNQRENSNEAEESKKEQSCTAQISIVKISLREEKESSSQESVKGQTFRVYLNHLEPV